MFLFSFIYSNYINSDNPSEPLNQKKIIKIISKLIFKLKEYFLIDIFYDKNNNNIFALTMKKEFNKINNFNILFFDVSKNKITLKTKLQILDDYINNCIIFRNEYLIVSKKNSLRVFNVNNMKEIFSGINNLNLNDKDNIRGLMNFNKEFLLIFTEKKIIKYDLHKTEILYSSLFPFYYGSWINTKNYLFLYGRQNGVIIFDKKTIRHIQSKNISNILFIDEISDEKIKFTTACYNIFCDKSQKTKIFLFSCLRVFSFFLLLFLFIREIRIISSKKYKLLIYDSHNYLLKFKNIFENLKSIKLSNISYEDIFKYIKSIWFSSDNYVLIALKIVYYFLINLGVLLLSSLIFYFKVIVGLFFSPFIIIFMILIFIFFSNYLIIIIIRCILLLYYILALSFNYHKFSPHVTFISNYF